MTQQHADMFDVIEEVLRERIAGRTDAHAYRAIDAVLDVFTVANEQQPGVAMSRGEIHKVLFKSGKRVSVSSIGDAIRELVTMDELAGGEREHRVSIAGYETSVPVYRLAGSGGQNGNSA